MLAKLFVSLECFGVLYVLVFNREYKWLQKCCVKVWLMVSYYYIEAIRDLREIFFFLFFFFFK